MTDFDAQDASTLSLVKGDIALGGALALTGTPTFFINGVRIDSVLAPQYFEAAINYELQHAASRSPRAWLPMCGLVAELEGWRKHAASPDRTTDRRVIRAERVRARNRRFPGRVAGRRDRPY